MVIYWAAEVVRYLEDMTNGCDSDAATTEDGVEVRFSSGGASTGQVQSQEEIGRSFAITDRYRTLDAWSKRLLDKENRPVEELEWFGDERPQRAFRDNLAKVFTGAGDAQRR